MPQFLRRKVVRKGVPGSKRQSRPSRRRSSRRGRPLWWLGLIGLAGAAAFLVMTDGGLATREPGAITAHIENAARSVGLGLSQVTLTGHRFTPDSEIYKALSLESARTLLSFDAAAARARILELPWIEAVTIDRMVPDGLEVRVVERQPFAIWRRASDDVLIDADGRLLAHLQRGSAQGLPIISGEGAPRPAARLFAMLAGFPWLHAEVVEAIRVGDRRWTLLTRGGQILCRPRVRPQRWCG